MAGEAYKPTGPAIRAVYTSDEMKQILANHLLAQRGIEFNGLAAVECLFMLNDQGETTGARVEIIPAERA